MINIKYRINEEYLIKYNDDIANKPIIYGVFIIESNFGFSLRDGCMIDDELFQLFKFNDDLFDWFFNLNNISINLIKNPEKLFRIGYDLDTASTKNAIVFSRNKDKLNICMIEYEDQENKLGANVEIMPLCYTIVKDFDCIDINDWLENISKTTQQFIKEIIKLQKNFEKNQHIIMVKNLLNEAIRHRL
ncbi:hypothetical protein [Moraxella marmotae]|uniref:hypothetical protein n=1 Tax=Moraxella marmotae TaxID=3344520 RepID=UPI0035F4858B